MHRIIYLSSATIPFTDKQLQHLLTGARRHNAQAGITGILLYGNERFMQVLEGEETTVRALYTRIKRDARHHHVVAYADKPVARRAFAGWAMAFAATTPQQFDQVAGYVVPTEARVDATHLPLAEIHLIDLLRSFTQP